MKMQNKPSSLLIFNAEALVTMIKEQPVINNGYVLIQNGMVREIGKATGKSPQEIIAGDKRCTVIRADGKVVVPGLINTHHHLYQTLTRAYPPVMNSALFHWLKNLYPIWARLDEEAIRLSSLVGMAELMLSGCTTTTDHHYVFPQGISRELIDIQVEAAHELGMRFHPCRGSMNLSEKDGGLPPDLVVQTEDEILKDSERLIAKYHDPSPGAMTQIALAPCSPFSVTTELMKNTAALALEKGVRLHTHLAETIDEENFCLKKFGSRPVDYLEQVGWLNNSAWLAHGIHFSSEEIMRLGTAGVGVAHCPGSNMRLGSGIAKVTELQAAGSPIGLAVDGSASNDASNMLAEVRQALLLARLARGADSMTVLDAFHIATVGSAACLGRSDLGTLEHGKAADVAIFALDDIGYSGAGDPVGALLLCQPTRVDTLIINGKIVVEQGRLKTLNLEPILEAHRKKAKTMQA
ncbi:hydroxydechloroatrazine ethylaminohydrolase [Candidatus Vecturithrix granuli]|uniref:Hydroxydechloroatrazine ethylaminohydrolase n=1 Tax=Vecturithrix granuli TaxID=1499967 RepID=A0A081BYZ0_VECG1|nr:hydroxydechloroatrazine ethylaminohydrolase [Candidatus Vecturithrix granuli]